MFNIVDKVKGIKDTVVDKVAEKKKSLGNSDTADTSNNPLRDFTAFKVVGEGYFPIKEYVDFDKPVDIHNLPIGIKEDKSAGLVTIDAHQDNFLVAGSAGSGKSVVVRAIVSQLAKTNAIIYGVDLKQTELFVFDDVFTAIATETNEATVLIDGLIEEVEHRLNYIKDKGKTEIDSDDDTHPPIVLIIDEYAELVSPLGDNKEEETKRVEEVKNKVATLTKLSRLAGLSVFVFTQSPKKEHLTDEVLENINNRIGLFTSTRSQLKAIIGETALEVESLKQTERAGYFVKGEDEPIKFKPLWISDEESKEINDATKGNKKTLNTKSMKKFETIAWENFVNRLDISDDGKDKMTHTKNIIDLAHDISLEDGKVIRNYIIHSDSFSKIMAEHYKGYDALDLFLIDFDRRLDIAHYKEQEEKEDN